MKIEVDDKEGSLIDKAIVKFRQYSRVRRSNVMTFSSGIAAAID